jgi:hypothetical protein
MYSNCVVMEVTNYPPMFIAQRTCSYRFQGLAVGAVGLGLLRTVY